MKKNNRSYNITNYVSTLLNTANIPLIPIIIALVFVPLIVRVKVLTVPGTNLVWANNSAVQMVDIFAYYKGFWLITAAVIATLILLLQLTKTKSFYKHHKSQYLLGGYLLLVFLSFAFSINHGVSLLGYDEHYENVFVLVSYILLFTYTAQIINSEAQLKVLIGLWSISIVIMFLIGLSQFFNSDFFMTDFGKSLIIPAVFRGAATASQDTDTARNVYQTLFHYNYVSFYASIGLPFFLVLSILEKAKKKRLFYMAMVLIFAFNQYASLSRNGFFGIGVALVVALFFLRKILFKKWYLFIPAILIIVISAGIYVSQSDSLTASRLRQALKDVTTTQTYPLKKIVTYKGHVDIEHELFELQIDYLSSASNNEIPYDFIKADGSSYVSYALDDDFKYALEGIDPNVLSYQAGKLNEQDAINLTIENQTYPFLYDKGGFVYINPIGKIDIIPEIEHFGFEGRERFGSARGYIWSRTIPLFKDYGLLGSGPDTFALVFPQNDYVGKYNAYTTSNMVVDKPHNLYFNYAINTGLPSLFFLLLFWGYYLISSARIYFNNDFSTAYAKYGMAAMAAVIGYLASGVFNDTNLNVTPLFWIILGIGYSANHLVKGNTTA